MANNLTRIKNNQVTDRTLTNVKIATSTLTGDLFNPDLTFNSNITISGNLTVTGNVTSVQSSSTQITDPLITLGIGNAGTSYDEGLIFTRGGTGNYFLGWKENLDELVFINTSETGSTTGNITTTSYGNIRFGNSTILGTGVVGLVSMSSGTVTTTSGNLTLTSTAGNVNVTGGITATGAISAASLYVTSLSAASINNTPIGNATPSTGAFTTLAATSTLNVAGTATVNSLVSNGAISGTTGTFTGAVAGTSTANFAGTATVNSLVSNGTISGTQITGTNGLVLNTNATVTTDQTTASLFNTTATTLNIGGAGTAVTIGATTGNTIIRNNEYVGGTLTVSSSATVNSLTSNGNVSGTNASFTGVVGTGNLTTTGFHNISSTLSVGGTATVNSLVSNGAISGTTGTYTGALATTSTLNAAGTATVNSLVSNGAITGTTAGFTSTGNFAGAVTVNSLASNGAITGTTAGFTSTGNFAGAVTVNSLISNGAISGTTGTFSGNVSVGNLSVNGTLTYVNSTTLEVVDPIIELNTTANGGALTLDNNFDSGIRTHYYDGTADRSAFFGRTDDTGYFEFYSNVTTEANNVIGGTYGTIKSGNLIMTGTGSFGSTLNVSGALTVNSIASNGAITGTTAGFTSTGNFGGAVTVNSLVSNGAISGTTGTFTGALATTSTFNAAGTATVNALVSNGAISGTSGTLTAGLTLNTNATINTNQTTASVFNTTATTLNIGGAGTAITIGATTGNTIVRNNEYVGGTLTVSSAATVNSLTVNGAVSTGNITTVGFHNISSTLNVGGTTTVNSLVSNGAISGTTGTFTGAVAGTSTANFAGTATVNALSSNSTVTAGTTITATAGLQNTAIGNVTPNTAAFTTLTASGLTTITNATASTTYNNGAVVVTGGVGIAGNLNVSGTSYANLANIQIVGNLITSITPNGNLNLGANGTGTVVVNSLQDGTKFTVKGNTANANVGNLFTVSTSTNQVGVRQSTFIDGAAFQINSTDSMLLPVGAQGDRPSSPVTGMFRYSTTAGAVEWYDGSGWGTASTQFTIVQANTALGDGGTTDFTLPISNASTAGTIVSINGIVQKPVDAYGITGSTLSFTEAPASGDIIDIRAFTTTVTVTSLVDAVGTTGLYLDDAAVDDKIIVFKNNSVNNISIDADGYLEMKSNGFIISTPSVTAAATATTIDTFAASSYRAAKYLVTARNSGSTQWTTMEALVVHDGTTATITTYGIVNTGATTQVTMSATVSGGNVLVQATGAAAGTVVNFEKTYIVGS